MPYTLASAATPTCIITGCDFYDPEHNRWCHGDLFQFGDTLIFNGCYNKTDPWWHEGKPLDTNKVVAALVHWERRGVFVFPVENAMFNATASAYLL